MQSSYQRRRERNNLRSRFKRAFLHNGGTRSTARALCPFVTGERRVVMRRIAGGTMACAALIYGGGARH